MKTTMKYLPFFIFSALVFSCGGQKESSTTKDVFADNVDSTANPAKDFFQFVNGKWFKNNPIPASETSWGIGNVVEEEVYANLRKINEDAASQKATSGDSQQIGDFWSTGMDSAKADKLGVTPLQEELEQIDQIKNVNDVVKTMTALEPLGLDIFYSGIIVGQDEKNSEIMTLHISQGGLGLPDRDYYFDADQDTNRQCYVLHMAKMLEMIDRNRTDLNNNVILETPNYRSEAKDILAFETSLAKNSRKLEDTRDPYANYNKMGTNEATQKLTPSIDWKNVFASNGLPNVDTVIIGQPEFFSGLEKSIHETDVEVLKNYMRFHLVSAYASYLSKPFDMEDFYFFHDTLRGADSQRPRWKRVLDSEEDAMGMVLGKLFVKEYFPEKTKKRYDDMVEAIRTAYAERIKKLDWMSETTKTKALDKLAKVTKKVGYPDKWKDYSKLIVGTNSYCENIINSSRWHFNDMISKFGKPVDRTEWDMTPQTYNAYYNPSNNEIVLPAAIFTIPGFPDSLIDDAVVYGYAAASTIGHEITHGFDDEGRNYDAAGNLVSWWTPEDSAQFEERAAMMVKEFDAFEPLPGKHINGKASLGENIADYGGILLGIDAFKKTEQYQKGEKIAGYTPMQRYFMGYALGWMIQQREKELGRRLMTDVHSPAKWRVIGPFSNLPEFYDAFGVKEGDPMWRPDSLRVHIW
jgi:putative endopeptidase